MLDYSDWSDTGALAALTRAPLANHELPQLFSLMARLFGKEPWYVYRWSPSDIESDSPTQLQCVSVRYEPECEKFAVQPAHHPININSFLTSHFGPDLIRGLTKQRDTTLSFRVCQSPEVLLGLISGQPDKFSILLEMPGRGPLCKDRFGLFRSLLPMLATPLGDHLFPPSPDTSLTGRECEILSLAAEGVCTKEIASILCITQRTVHFHLNKAYRKLGVRNRQQAILAAQRFNLLNRDMETHRLARADFEKVGGGRVSLLFSPVQTSVSGRRGNTSKPFFM